MDISGFSDMSGVVLPSDDAMIQLHYRLMMESMVDQPVQAEPVVGGWHVHRGSILEEVFC